MAPVQPLKHRPVVLLILDGWGVALPSHANAITQSSTPHFDEYVSQYPICTLQASGEAAGLPWGEVGNSEVGHMCIGAGRIVYQDLSRINAAISDGSFFTNDKILAACAQAKLHGSTLHLIGMVSPGGVHSHTDHLYALLEVAQAQGVSRIAIHAILDGRDTSYASAEHYISQLSEKISSFPNVWIASLAGRYYAMDRDNHWDRIEKVYRILTQGTDARIADSPLDAIRDSYARAVYDEEFEPTVIPRGGAPTLLQDKDSVVFFNIRPDRMRQLVHVFADERFERFERGPRKELTIVTFTQYDAALASVAVAFPQQIIKECLAETISAAGLAQLHVAETEKYAHITYFLNAGREEPFAREKRIMVPSPAVDTYDKKPEMSAREVGAAVVKAISEGSYDFIAANFANADMVGHTGMMESTMKAVETIDHQLGIIVPAVLAKGGAVVITSDHGNAEVLIDLKTGDIDKEHNMSPVPCIIVAKDFQGKTFHPSDIFHKDLSVMEASGLLSDVAPTVLELLGIPKPSEMTGKSLLNI